MQPEWWFYIFLDERPFRLGIAWCIQHALSVVEKFRWEIRPRGCVNLGGTCGGHELWTAL